MNTHKTSTGGAVPIMNQYDIHVSTSSEMVPCLLGYRFGNISANHKRLPLQY